MSSVTFPNGQTLTSTALTPDGVNLFFQSLVAQTLGLNPATDPDTAFAAVRVGWQPQGQPAWKITDDVCIVRSRADNHPYSQVRDSLYQPNSDPAKIDEPMSFTQVWSVYLTLYGPNSYDRGRQINSAMSLDWVHDAMAAANLYIIPTAPRPSYVPELFQGQWWKRTDVRFQFNELVNESITLPSAASFPVELIKENGITTSFTIPPSA